MNPLVVRKYAQNNRCFVPWTGWSGKRDGVWAGGLFACLSGERPPFSGVPEALGERYRPVACLKDGERQVYLVQDQDGRPAVLKVQPAGREDTLRQEYELLRQLHHPQLPGPGLPESHGPGVSGAGICGRVVSLV